MKKFSLILVAFWSISFIGGFIFGARKKLKKQEREARAFISKNQVYNTNFWTNGQPVGKA